MRVGSDCYGLKGPGSLAERPSPGLLSSRGRAISVRPQCDCRRRDPPLRCCSCPNLPNRKFRKTQFPQREVPQMAFEPHVKPLPRRRRAIEQLAVLCDPFCTTFDRHGDGLTPERIDAGPLGDDRGLTPDMAGQAKALSASFNRCLVFSTPSNRSPCCATRCCTTSIVNWAGSSPGLTSFQRSGVDTGAPGRGRTEYAEAIVFPSPFWFASIRTPRRFAFDHCVVASFGYERAIAPATISEKRRVSS